MIEARCQVWIILPALAAVSALAWLAYCLPAASPRSAKGDVTKKCVKLCCSRSGKPGADQANRGMPAERRYLPCKQLLRNGRVLLSIDEPGSGWQLVHNHEGSLITYLLFLGLA